MSSAEDDDEDDDDEASSGDEVTAEVAAAASAEAARAQQQLLYIAAEHALLTPAEAPAEATILASMHSPALTGALLPRSPGLNDELPVARLSSHRPVCSRTRLRTSDAASERALYCHTPMTPPLHSPPPGGQPQQAGGTLVGGEGEEEEPIICDRVAVLSEKAQRLFAQLCFAIDEPLPRRLEVKETEEEAPPEAATRGGEEEEGRAPRGDRGRDHRRSPAAREEATDSGRFLERLQDEIEGLKFRVSSVELELAKARKQGYVSSFDRENVDPNENASPLKESPNKAFQGHGDSKGLRSPQRPQVVTPPVQQQLLQKRILPPPPQALEDQAVVHTARVAHGGSSCGLAVVATSRGPMTQRQYSGSSVTAALQRRASAGVTPQVYIPGPAQAVQLVNGVGGIATPQQPLLRAVVAPQAAVGTAIR